MTLDHWIGHVSGICVLLYHQPSPPVGVLHGQRLAMQSTDDSACTDSRVPPPRNYRCRFELEFATSSLGLTLFKQVALTERSAIRPASTGCREPAVPACRAVPAPVPRYRSATLSSVSETDSTCCGPRAPPAP